MAEVEYLEPLAPDHGHEAAQVRAGGLLYPQPLECVAHLGETAGLIITGEQHLDPEVCHRGGPPNVQSLQVGAGGADNV